MERGRNRHVEHAVSDEEGGDMDPDDMEFDAAEQADIEMNFDMDFNDDGNI